MRDQGSSSHVRIRHGTFHEASRRPSESSSAISSLSYDERLQPVQEEPHQEARYCYHVETLWEAPLTEQPPPPQSPPGRSRKGSGDVSSSNTAPGQSVVHW